MRQRAKRQVLERRKPGLDAARLEQFLDLLGVNLFERLFRLIAISLPIAPAQHRETAYAYDVDVLLFDQNPIPTGYVATISLPKRD